ncbi:hypothetical protein [Geomicrobium sp. JCM 19055]|uniref:hypothetical protein n=1 Tax=Geomicrobium sp. JCM 19055 TaxID=1460649 RepID=UPI00045ED8CC|nr:hypothetical protein [Geomicrobium sp. JCM 19055]GAJ97790.1 hypothetical protein JCM19055_669 [Geomicrobium sp. JCM 19055]
MGIFGYYGSRICEYVERIPKTVCMLLYPHVEKSFAVDVLVDKRKAKGMITHIYPAEHGFSNIQLIHQND